MAFLGEECNLGPFLSCSPQALLIMLQCVEETAIAFQLFLSHPVSPLHRKSEVAFSVMRQGPGASQREQWSQNSALRGGTAENSNLTPGRGVREAAGARPDGHWEGASGQTGTVSLQGCRAQQFLGPCKCLRMTLQPTRSPSLLCH